jgi:hypothetical protein
VAAAALALSPLLLAAYPAAAQYTGPTPYLAAADSPYSGLTFSYFFLENFEDGLLNTTGLSASAGTTLVGNDSVEAGGGSYYSSGANSLTFTFSAAALGTLPTHAGVVWTDVGFTTGALGFGNVTFEAFDAANASLGVFGPFLLGDGSASPAKAEDRFFGISNAGGISSIRMTMPDSTDWEVDHVQYGRVAASAAAPEPSALALLLPALPLTAMLIRRRPHKA